MAKTTKLGSRFLALLSALSLVGAGALVAIAPASALAATGTTITFEADDTIGAGAVGNNSGDDPTGSFSGLTTMIADAGDDGGTGKILEMAKAGDAWAGVVIMKTDTIKIGADLSFDLYSPDPTGTSACVKIENADASAIVEYNIAATNGWHNYELDLSTDSQWNASADYVTLVFFPDFACGEAGTTVDRTGQVYAIDNIELNGGYAAAPVKTKNPTISGTVKVGKTLTANGFASSWEGEPTLAYKWYSCSAKGTNNPASAPANCKAIAGATAKKLTLKSAQKGKFIRVRVTATNGGGSVSVFSDSTKV
ncbi:MAG: hypothetical protein RLZZ330_1194, partial [Actinomycetota bacterium]